MRGRLDRVINADGHPADASAIRELKQEDELGLELPLPIVWVIPRNP